MKTTLVLWAFLILGIAVPALGKTYKNTYSVPCSDVWPGVKQVLAGADNYNVKATDDAKMHADFQPKHSAHVNVSGVLLQRENHVTLVTKGSGCEMQVVSNYSGWEHDDQGDFKKRVDEAMLALKAAKPQTPAVTGEVK
ncbi:MAG TPA: hypothetical protein VGL89_05340 [Candidatus Koribacter sp.]|jgi:hypothetical protein